MIGTNFSASNILVDTNATLNITWLEMKGTLDIRGTALVQQNSFIAGRGDSARATVTIENGGVLKANTGAFTIGPFSMVVGDGELGSMTTQVTNCEIRGQSGAVLDAFHLQNNGLITIDGGSVVVNGWLSNAGSLLLTNANTLQVNGDFYNTGTVHVQFNESGQIGVLNVVGPATLNRGTLSIFGSSFSPAIGTRYQFQRRDLTDDKAYNLITDVSLLDTGLDCCVFEDRIVLKE